MKRPGFTLYEVVGACVLLGAMAGLCLQFLRGAAAERRAVYQRQTAVQEAANLMERLCARPWDDLKEPAAGDVCLSPQAAQALPGGAVEAQIDPPAGTPPAKRIAVVVRWQPREGEPAGPVRLVAWRYKTP